MKLANQFKPSRNICTRFKAIVLLAHSIKHMLYTLAQSIFKHIANNLQINYFQYTEKFWYIQYWFQYLVQP